MATREDEMTINVIRSMVKQLEDQHLNVEEELADGVDIYYQAIRSVRNAGIWAVDIGLLDVVLMVIYVLNHDTGLPAYISLGIIVAAILISGHLALKLYWFKATPPMALFILLIIVPIEAFALHYWYIPLVAIPIIKALFKWSTYRSWYNEMRKLVAKKMKED